MKLNPRTGTAPVFLCPQDAFITSTIYDKFSIFIDDTKSDKEYWKAETRQGLFNTGSQKDKFYTSFKEGFLPLYEAKMTSWLDHRAVSYSEAISSISPIDISMKDNPEFRTTPRFWVTREAVLKQIGQRAHCGWLIGWHRITDTNTMSRSVIPTVIPISGVADGIGLVFSEHRMLPCLVAAMACTIFDYVARQKIGGTHLDQYHFEQLAVIPPYYFSVSALWEEDLSVFSWIFSRIAELVFVSWELQPFAKSVDYDGPPFRWDEDRRFLIRCELDAAFFHLYLGCEQEWKKTGSKELIEYFPTPRYAVDYIMETFPIVKRKDEKQYGEYRTKRVILEIYDEMAQVMEENAATVDAGRQPTAQYKTRLNPPPGPPCDAQGNFIPMAQWDNLPVHIHSTKEKAEKTPEEISLEEFAEMTYPNTEIDNVICATALAIVEQSDEISSMDHLDTLLLATHSDWCKTFLDQSKHRAFDVVKQSTPSAILVDNNQSIRWKECRDYLEQQRLAISVNHGNMEQIITLGSEWLSVKASLPSGADDIVKYAIEAMKRITDLRKDLSSVQQDQLRIIQAFEEQHRIYQLAA